MPGLGLVTIIIHYWRGNMWTATKSQNAFSICHNLFNIVTARDNTCCEATHIITVGWNMGKISFISLKINKGSNMTKQQILPVTKWGPIAKSIWFDFVMQYAKSQQWICLSIKVQVITKINPFTSTSKDIISFREGFRFSNRILAKCLLNLMSASKKNQALEFFCQSGFLIVLRRSKRKWKTGNEKD